MNTKNIIWGILAGFTGGTIFGLVATSEKSVLMRKKVFGKIDHYASSIISRFNKKAPLLADADPSTSGKENAKPIK